MLRDSHSVHRTPREVVRECIWEGGGGATAERTLAEGVRARCVSVSGAVTCLITSLRSVLQRGGEAGSGSREAHQ